MCRDNGLALRFGYPPPVRRTANSTTEDGREGCTCFQLCNNRLPRRQGLGSNCPDRLQIVCRPCFPPREAVRLVMFHATGNKAMSRQPAAVSRSILAAATAFRMSVVGCLLLAGSHLGVARWGRQEGHEIDGVFRSGSRRANVQPGNQCPRTAAFLLDRASARALRFSQKASTSPDAASSLCRPVLLNRNSRPPTEGLREDRPTQVRVDVRRWRAAILADGGRALLGGRLPNRRTLCGASKMPCPSLSLHELFCTWVI
jgi:hypothetical protein